MQHVPPFGGEPNENFVDRNLETGTAGSKVPAQFFNTILAELLHVIEYAGITPSAEDLQQIRKAIQALANFNISSLTEETGFEPNDDDIPFFDASSGEEGDERKIKGSALLSRLMGGRMSIAGDANWNTVITPGMYNTSGSGYSNGPLGASAHPGALWVIGRSQSANHATQLFFYSAAVPAIWTRTTTDGGANWSAWRKLGDPAAGSVIQTVYAENTSNLTINTTIPLDNTTPLHTEGVEVLSQSITPREGTSKLLVRAVIFLGSNTNNNNHGAIAIFSGTTCIDAGLIHGEQSGVDFTQIIAEVLVPATDTAARTISVRVGRTAQAFILNADGGGNPVFNGNSRAVLTIQEIKQ